MDPNRKPHGSKSDDEPIALAATMGNKTCLPKSRNYQKEMFEESLRRNIIVAMDTGSGKTLIAIMRIYEQLDRGDGKISWFLIPGAELAKQQHQVLVNALPPVGVTLLTGASGVDKWSNKETWDELLKTPVIITTHQVLLDALSHGFVQMERIGLLIFDEAHHCIQNHPANMIMRHFYHHRAREGLPVPDILGLTASPVLRSDPTQLKIIEANLNAIARTPLKHRDELLRHVRPPKLKLVEYDGPAKPVSAPDTATSSWADHLVLPHRRVVPQRPVKDKKAAKTAKTVKLYNAEAAASAPGGITSDSDSDFEIINPITGELSTEPARVATRTRQHYQISSGAEMDGDDEFDDVDPLTGELVSATTGKAISPKRRKSSASVRTPYEIAPINLYTSRRRQPGTRVPKPLSPHKEMPASLASLVKAYENMDIMEDPYVRILMRRSGDGNAHQLQRIIAGNKTYSREHMRWFVNKARHIMFECGEWATNWFISRVVNAFLHRLDPEKVTDNTQRDDEDEDYDDDDDGGDGQGGPEAGVFSRDEVEYMCSILRRVVLPSTPLPLEGNVTAKVDKLIEVLLEEYSAEHSEFSGLVFVTQRAAVAAVAKIISSHPKTRDHFRVGTMVGTSVTSNKDRKFLHDILVCGKKQGSTLKAFRSGKLNLLIATAAIEEGIDIQDCHLVVCFDMPPSLKSFIQRRGRARHEASSYVIMLGSNDSNGILAFQEMEKEMVKMYSDENRVLEQLAAASDDGEEEEGRTMKVEKTGALLTFGNALPHLYHFCSCMPMGEFTDSRPEFQTLCTVADSLVGTREWTAVVILPNAIDQAIRRTPGTRAWRSEDMAKRDAAFEAFVKLYKLQLVDDYLMPLVKGEFQNQQEVQKRVPRVQVDQCMDIWADIGKKWDGAEALYLMTLTLDHVTGSTVSVDMMLPVEFPCVQQLELLWPIGGAVNARFGRSRRVDYDPELVERGRKATRRLLGTVFEVRMEASRDDFLYLFLPCEGDSWDLLPNVQQNALELINERKGDMSNIGLLRNLPYQGFIFRRLATDVRIDEADDFRGNSPRNRNNVREDQPLVEVHELPKRRDFLHDDGTYRPRKTLLLLPEFLTVDPIPWKYTQMALFLPALINRVEKAFLAADLKKTLQLDIPNQLLVHATTTSGARDPEDYQRLEFLGDSVLKILASVALMDEFPLWPEGYLTAAKDHVVSNGTSSKAAAEKGLSRWINQRAFTAQKWRPRYAGSDVTPTERKLLSTKILADVVESIIGASYLSGGFDRATQCCAIFNLGVEWTWHTLKDRTASLRAKALPSATERGSLTCPQYFAELQQLIGYSFNNPRLLIEATTHLSYSGGDSTSTASYQRLEFLGDAVLDTVIVNALYHFPGLEAPLTHISMHHLKSTCVNAHFLAYICLGTSLTVERTEANPYSAPTRRKVELALHRFLRHNNPELRAAQKRCVRRYASWRDTIAHQLATAPEYPWTDLQELDAPKHLSDIIESIIGAIWIDSDGSFEAVEAFLERLGIMDVLRRLVRDNVIVNHPLSRFGIMVSQRAKGVVNYHCEEMEGGLCSCELTLGRQMLIKVERCANRQHARTKAARAGIDICTAMELEKEREDKENKENKEADEERRLSGEEGEEEEAVAWEKKSSSDDDAVEYTNAEMEDVAEQPADLKFSRTQYRPVLRSADVLLKESKGANEHDESSSEDAEFFDAKAYPSSAVSEAGGAML